MDMNLFITFCILNIVNVIIQTIKSIATIKCKKGMAALVNAVAYGLYTVVLVYTTCELPLFTKALVVAVANLIGVYIVKAGEEKKRKDKLWKIEVTIPKEHFLTVKSLLSKVSCSYIELGNHVLFNAYCINQEESKIVRQVVERYGAKYFISESKLF